MTRVLNTFLERVGGADLRRRLSASLERAKPPHRENFDERRAWFCADWIGRVFAPAWLRKAGLHEQADTLSQLDPIDSRLKKDAAKAFREARDSASRGEPWDQFNWGRVQNHAAATGYQAASYAMMVRIDLGDRVSKLVNECAVRAIGRAVLDEYERLPSGITPNVSGQLIREAIRPVREDLERGTSLLFGRMLTAPLVLSWQEIIAVEDAWPSEGLLRLSSASEEMARAEISRALTACR